MRAGGKAHCSIGFAAPVTLRLGATWAVVQQPPPSGSGLGVGVGRGVEVGGGWVAVATKVGACATLATVGTVVGGGTKTWAWLLLEPPENGRTTRASTSRTATNAPASVFCRAVKCPSQARNLGSSPDGAAMAGVGVNGAGVALAKGVMIGVNGGDGVGCARGTGGSGRCTPCVGAAHQGQ